MVTISYHGSQANPCPSMPVLFYECLDKMCKDVQDVDKKSSKNVNKMFRT